MTKLQVETYGGIGLRKRSIPSEEAAQVTLVDYAGAFSPRVESTCAGAAILDLAGTEKLFGPLQKTAHTLAAHAAEIGFDLRVAIAANPDTAFHAARGFPGITIIPAGEESPSLARLPVSVLTISPEILEVLNGWGIQTFHALAALPTVALVERSGPGRLASAKVGARANGSPVADRQSNHGISCRALNLMIP